MLARRGRIVALVEVKSARLPAASALDRPLDPELRPGRRVDAARLARLRRAAGRVSRALRAPARVDLIEVVLVPRRPPILLRHADLRAAHGGPTAVDLTRAVALTRAPRPPPEKRMQFTDPRAGPDG